MEPDVALLQRLSQIGYMACMQVSPSKGEQILEAVNSLKPEQTPTLIGLAMGRIANNKAGQAVKILRDQVLAKEPEHITAKCFLGMALLELGQHREGQCYLEDVVKNGNDDQKLVAEAYLGA